MKARGSKKATQFTESVIREMTRLAQEFDAVNLSQGFPDFATHQTLKDAACAAIQGDINQYPITWGAENLRAGDRARFFDGATACKVDETQVTVCCGSTEAMLSTLLAVLDPGDEVVIFEPYYENYGPDSIISGAVPRFVRLREPDWTFDHAELEAAFNNRTRAIIINTPNNPTGKVFTQGGAADHRQALPEVGRARDHRRDLRAHHLRRPQARADGVDRRHGRPHRDDQRAVEDLQRHGMARGLGDRAERPGRPIRKMHDFLTVGAPAPLQEAGVAALVDAGELLHRDGGRLRAPARS